MPTLYAVTIDTEEQWDWTAGWPVRSQSLDNIQVMPRFHQLCAGYGAKTTWFTNWSVLNDDRACTTMLEIATRPGVELGMHIHPWLTPPRDPQTETRGRDSYLHNQPGEIVAAKLDSVYELFTRNGLKPTSFRGGRYSSGGPIHDFLLSRGFVADSSVVPFTSWGEEGAPDFHDRDLTPRRIAGPAGATYLWELPLTLAFTRTDFRAWAARFHAIESSFLRHLRLIGILGKLGIVMQIWLNFETSSAVEMFALLRVLRPLQLPFVIFTVHSSSLVVGGNPYSASEAKVSQIWSAAEQVLAELKTWPDFQPATVTEIAQFLENSHRKQLSDVLDDRRSLHGVSLPT